MITIDTPNDLYVFSKSKEGRTIKVRTTETALDLMFCAEIFVQDGAFIPNQTSTLLDTTLELKADQNGCAIFDPFYILDSCLKFDCPEFGSNIPMIHENAVRGYSIRVSQKYIDATGVEQHNGFTSISGIIVKGGIEEKLGMTAQQYLESRHEIWTSQPNPEKLFLNHAPEPTKITCIQPIWLTALIRNDVVGLILIGEVTITKKDGTTITHQKNFPVLDNVYGYVSFPSGYCQLDIDCPTEEIAEYSFQLVDSDGNIYVQKKKFCFVQHTSCTKYYKFHNSEGGIENILTQGHRTYQFITSGETGTNEKGDTLQFKKKKRKQYIQQTGYIYSKCEIEYIQHLLMANSVIEIVFCEKKAKCPDPKNGQYCKMEIPYGATTIKTDNQKLINLNFNLIESSQEVVCSPSICPCLDEARIKINKIEDFEEGWTVTTTADDYISPNSAIVSEINEISFDGGVTWQTITLPHIWTGGSLPENGILFRRFIKTLACDFSLTTTDSCFPCDLPCDGNFKECAYPTTDTLFSASFANGGTYEWIITKFEIDEQNLLSSPITLQANSTNTNNVFIGTFNYDTVFVDLLNTLGIGYITFHYPLETDGRILKSFRIKFPACQTFSLCIERPDGVVYEYTNDNIFVDYNGTIFDWNNDGLWADNYLAARNCIETNEC